MKRKSKFLASLLSAAMLLNIGGSFMSGFYADTTVSAVTLNQVESLDRGISAINTGQGMMVSWRFLANDANDAVFKLYRDDTLIYTSNSSNATCYLDSSGSSSSKYRVDTVVAGVVKSSDNCSLISNNDYFQLNLSPPGSGYTPNDCSVGDVDGDGQYEIFLKWDPANAKDNSQSGVTGKVYIDCIKLNGTRLWRIDLGINIRAGAHYTQMLVADFDGDGYAEMTCKTADGTVDGTGKVIGDSSKDYRNSSGYILSGPEYYTLFDGMTGAALDTVNYNPQRGTVSSWGDNYGNRVDRFLGAVAYLDGQKPSAVTIRGYYTRMTACAYDVVNKKLVQRWYFDSNNSGNSAARGNGNHNCMPADVDGDGKQEIILGSTCIDDDGTLKWCTGAGHGDALHVGDLLPNRSGLEVWMCHENSPYGVSLLDAATGKVIYRKNGSSDTGRCCAGNVWAGNDGSEFWGLGNDVFDGSGNTLSCRRPAMNFLSYWDGDLEREILDGYTDSPATISKMDASGRLNTILTTTGYYTCNTTKGTPCLSADLFGDWREELIVRASDSKSIRIYCTPYTTDHRITTLMHDPQYRNQVAGQNIAYNQPPHPSFYLGSDEPLPPRPIVEVVGAEPIVIDPLNGTLIKELNRLDLANYVNWSIQTNLNTGDLVYGDRTSTFTLVPEALKGAEWIRVACDSKSMLSDVANFTAGKAISVFIGLETRVTNIPSWLNGWIDTEAEIAASNGVFYRIYQKDFAEGELVTLGTNGTSAGVQMYLAFAALQGTVVLKEIEPLEGTLIKSLKCLDLANYQNWSIQNNLNTDDLIYGDRTFTFANVPAILKGSEWIKAACDSKSATSDVASFTAGKDISVYIGLDTRVAEFPAWMNGWTDTKTSFAASNDVTYTVYQKDFSSGEEVTLGSNGNPSGVVMYVVFATEQGEVKTSGDVNGDGIVDIKDLEMLKIYILGKSAVLTDYDAADMNKDGIINSADCALLNKALIY